MVHTFTLDDLTPTGRVEFTAYLDRKRGECWAAADPSKARLYFDDHVTEYPDDKLAYAVWLGLGKGIRCAFRGAGDKRPVYPHDLVDQP